MSILELLNELALQCDLSQQQKKVVSDDGIAVTVFNDGDIEHVQDILTGFGSYLTSDAHEGYELYWGGSDDACVLMSFHDADGDMEHPYFGLNFLDTENEARQIANEYFGHRFIVLVKLSEIDRVNGFVVLNDEIGIEDKLTDVCYRDIVLHLSKVSGLTLLIESKMYQRSADEEQDRLDAIAV